MAPGRVGTLTKGALGTVHKVCDYISGNQKEQSQEYDKPRNISVRFTWLVSWIRMDHT